MTDKPDDTSVRVAVRVRPQSSKELIDMCQVCTNVTSTEPQIFLGKDKAFTYDYVFDVDSVQEEIYNACCRSLIEGCFEGYNATVFAYGQTGAGKTYTMGTGFDVNIAPEVVGIIPRAVEHLFLGIEQRKNKAHDAGEPPPDFKVNAQFMELYNEEVLDLLDTTRDPVESRGKKSHIRIHEDATGNIYTVGVTTRPVASVQDTIQCLKIGALSRTTASTNMNVSSSRSHAIFTLHIKQIRVVKEEVAGEDEDEPQTQVMNEFETLTAKFHFVDLAGSERLKRTGATGDRAKEGISINCGLLALGNVISALGDKQKKGSHVPYRDSKLTRLLQDSLGGNSRTVMIACVSPSDRDFMETLNTLKYANRARNIKNKVMVNQDKTSKQIAALRAEIIALQEEIMDYKTGKRMVGEDGVETVNDMFHENTMLQQDNDKLRQRIKAMQETIEGLTLRNTELLSEKELLNLANLPNDKINDEMKEIIQNHVREVENLRAKLLEAEAMAEGLKRAASRATPSRLSMSPMGVPVTGTSMDFGFDMTSPDQLTTLLAEAKQEVNREKKRVKERRSRASHGSDKENVSEDEKQDHEDLESPDKEEASEVGQDGDATDDDDVTELEEDEEGGGEDLEEMSDSDDDMETESTKNPDHIHEDLAKLTCEISIKQKLIEELEHSQKQLQNMKQHYEHKMVTLQARIQETELERDKVLSDIGSKTHDSKEKVQKVREEYEKKLSSMQTEMKKLQATVKEHTKHIRNQQMNEKKLRQMQNELAEAKRNKVQMMNKMKEEAQKSRASEARRSKEIAQLKKEQRVRDYTIRKIEAEKRQQSIVLRRKQEEVEALRKRQKPNLSTKASGRIGNYDKAPTKPVSSIGRYTRTKRFSAKAAKAKWDNLEKMVSSVVTKKHTLLHMERDMDRWVKEREHVGKRLEKFNKKREKLVMEDNAAALQDLDDQIETLRANLDYIQENIQESQSNIVQMEETNKEEDPVSWLNVTNLEEAKYLLEHFVNLAISKGLVASQKESENSELTQKLNHEKQNATYQQEILQYLIQDHVEIEVDNSLINAQEEDSDNESSPSSRSVSPVDSLEANSPVGTPGAVAPPVPIGSSTPDVLNKPKARRKTATPEDLLYAGATPVETPKPLIPLIETPDEEKTASPAAVNGGNGGADAAAMPPPKTAPVSSRIPARPSSAGPSPGLGGRKQISKGETTPTTKRKLGAQAAGATATRPGSAPFRRKTYRDKISDSSDLTPPSSPTSARRVRDENVFNRLTNNKRIPASPHIYRGKIQQASSRGQKTGAPLVHSFTADGHTKAVLSVFATNDLMFSSSKDRTAKVWDLTTGKESLTLSGHPNNVICVRYNDYTKLIYTVSTYFIKLWDLRDPSRCIKSLTSSGMTSDGSLAGESSRQVTCPPGETNITDISVSTGGTVMYSAAGNTVRMWDLRNYKAVGKLAGGHQSAVMVLAVDDTDTADGNICVVTGSKDHYIKVFEVSEDSTGVLTPKYNLEPPHYDGIQSLCLMGDLLFSGSRDMCIKKWDLADQQLKHSINGSHKDWVTGLTFTPGGNNLLSGCRGGFLKLWNIDTCAQEGEIKAHDKPINCTTTNDNLIFTASDDRTIRLWQPQASGFDSD